ncbi:MAG TPA: HD domain-containing protein [Thermoleophilia bacterium]|nr:HD domain-containing protein [Thermoleophilia bacterium]
MHLVEHALSKAATEYAAHLVENQAFDSYFVCFEPERGTKKSGEPFLRMGLRDASGDVKAVWWEPTVEALEGLRSGHVVKVRASFCASGRWGPQVTIERLRTLEPGEYDPACLVPVSPVADPGLSTLLRRAFDPSREPGATFAVAPAAVRNHHAYRHGLLEHSIVVAEVAAAVVESFPAADRNLVVAGALLHDIGKTFTYSSDLLAPGFTDAGRLHGEIVIGHDLVRDLIAETPGLSPELSARLRHVILSHHGEREKGSPVVPMTREAIVVHFCDDMTARISAVDDAERSSTQGARWSGYSKMLEAFVYLGDGADAGDGGDGAELAKADGFAGNGKDPG